MIPTTLTYRLLVVLAILAIVGMSLAPRPWIGVSAATTYSSTVLADSPVSYWRLGETSGSTASDSASGGNPGTISSAGVTLGVPGALIGDTNSAMNFDGTSGSISVPDKANLDMTSTLTVEAWVKPASLDGQNHTVVHKGGTTCSTGYQYRLMLYYTNQWRGLVCIGGTGYDVLDTTDIPSTSSWTDLVLTRSGKTLSLYVNGQLMVQRTTIPTGSLVTSTSALGIGRVGGVAQDYFKGGIDEVAIYNTALSASQVQAHYQAGINPSTSTPTLTAAPATSTPTLTGTAVLPTSTPTSASTASATAFPTNTLVPPTNTPLPPTSTPVAATSTATSVSASYASTILGDGPVSYWRLGESSGSTAADSGPGGNPGSISGTGVALGIPGAIAGDPNTAMSFDGSSGYVGVSDRATLDITGDLTIEAWVKPTSVDTNVHVIVHKGSYATGQYRLSMGSTGHWRGTVYSGSNVYSVTDPGTPSTSSWTYLVMTRSGSILTLYDNGVAVASSSNASGALNTTSQELGIGETGSDLVDFFHGGIDEVAIYAKALSATQIQAHYAAGTSGTPIPTSTLGPTASPTNAFVPSLTATTGPTATPAPTTTGDPVIMAAGDIACSPGDTSFNGGSGTASACQQLATASELHGVTAVLPLGDEQYEDGTLSAFQQAYDPSWGAMKAISYPVPGNHEYNTGSATGYFSYFGAAAGNSNQGYYSYNLGTWHLIALNSECSYIGGCAAGSAEETWLQSDLAVHTNVCTLAYWHEPLFTTGSVGPNTDMQTIWQDLYNAGVDVVLSGHAHDYEQFAPQTATGAYDPNRGIREFVVGTGGRNHLAFDPSASLGNTVVRDNTTFGVLKLVLHPASYDWQFMPDTQSGNGTFTDSGSAACH